MQYSPQTYFHLIDPMQTDKENIINKLLEHTLDFPGKTAFIVLGNDAETNQLISYRELALRVKTLAHALTKRQLAGQRVLLIYEDTAAFLVSFLACMYSRIIPVPLPFIKGGKQVARIMNIMADAQATAVLCSREVSIPWPQDPADSARFHPIELIYTDQLSTVPGDSELPPPSSHEIAFIQYTSGSTDTPKGVVITHANLVHNQRLIQNMFGCDPHSVIFSWLPFHHDMGLIGNILHTIHAGCTCILMSPLHFIQKPHRWLEGISRYKATHSGGPNFAYDLCVDKISSEEALQLDLSSWKVAYNGSEPVRADTLRRFAGHFKTACFDQNAFYPCYGLAEATLLVSGRKQQPHPVAVKIDRDLSTQGVIQLVADDHPNATSLVSSGHVADGMHVKILSVRDQRECQEREEGEICIAGDSVTGGYWNKDNDQVFYAAGGRSYLRTGDTGFFHEGALFVHGRIKEMLIVRGKNHYPPDIERLIAGSHHDLEPYGVAVFALSDLDEDFAVVAEVKRTALKELDAESAIWAIDRAVEGLLGVAPRDIILTTPLGIPRTTSGKLQRVKCQDKYRQQALNVLSSRLSVLENRYRRGKDDRLLVNLMQRRDRTAIQAYLVDLIEAKVGRLSPHGLNDSTELTEIGLDSLRAMELVNAVNKDLNINIDAARVFQHNTLTGLVNVIESILWLKEKQSFGKEITI